MKRGALTIAIFLLIGAVVNVAVAWACALWQPLELDFPVYERGWASGQRAAALLRVAIPKHAQVPNDYRPYVSTDRGLGWTMSSANFAHFIGCQLLTAGWPFRALRGEAWIDANGLRVANALLARSVTTGPSLIPVRPIWPGFLLNSAFYGMLGWFCAQRFASVRQSRRINRRLCPGCAYPMGESSVCSECGRELRVRHATLPSSHPRPSPSAPP